MNLFMKLISGVLHPLLMATYMSLILFLNVPEIFPFQLRTIIYLLLAVFLTTCAIPAFSIYSLRLFSFVSSLELTNRKERPFPFLLIFIWYAVASYVFVSRLQLGKPFSTIIIAVTILIGILFVITKWFKISIHSTAIWSAAGILASLVLFNDVAMQGALVISILLAGLVGTSRLYLGYHRPEEIWFGALLGFLFSFFALYFFG